MIRRVAVLIYGIASYFAFVCSIVYAMGFIGNYLVPRSIDVGPESGLGQAILIDPVLIAIFAVQHSVMARPAFKRWWTRSSRRPASAPLMSCLEPAADPPLLAVATDLRRSGTWGVLRRSC